MRFASALVILPLAALVGISAQAHSADLDVYPGDGASYHRHHRHHHRWVERAPAPISAPVLPSLADMLVLPVETPPPEMLLHHDRLLPPGVIYNVPTEPVYVRGPVIRANY